MKDSLFIFAGEKSGDLNGSALLKELKQHLPGFHFAGVGGPEMRRHGLECILRMEDFEVMGFTDVLWSLPKIYSQFYTVRDHILENNPKCVVLIDYPGFNLRIAKALRKKGYQGKIIQYVSPSVWAWGKGRIKQMCATLNLLLIIYPFESQCFSGTSLNVHYVGNPILEHLSNHPYNDSWGALTGIKNTENLIGIFPGSRAGEIRRNLPKQLEAAMLMKQYDPDVQFAVSSAHEEIIPLMQELLVDSDLKFGRDIFLVPRAYTYELMRTCRSAIAKSGTVTLELALHQCPTVVVYELTLLNRLIAQYLFRVNLPHYCIVNILSGKTVFPELIKTGFSAFSIFENVKMLHAEGTERSQCIAECNNIAQMLQKSKASAKAALAIQEILSC